MDPVRRPPGCRGCRHFRVTYDPAWPWACLFFGMKTRSLPSTVVERDSGQPCRAREERPRQRERR